MSQLASVVYIDSRHLRTLQRVFRALWPMVIGRTPRTAGVEAARLLVCHGRARQSRRPSPAQALAPVRYLICCPLP